MHSIRLRLLKWLIVPILTLYLAGGALVYALSWLPAQAAFDQNLHDAAAALAARLQHRGDKLVLDLPPQAAQILRNDTVDETYFAVRDSDGRLLAGETALPERTGRAGIAVDAAVRGEPVRLVLRQVDGGSVAVARTLRKRAQTRGAILRAMLPLAALFTLASVGLIWYSVSVGLRPLDRVRSDLKGRTPDDTSPIPAAELPDELGPLVRAFNGLLDRVSEGAKAQQAFLADVAHQLRTPLAGLRAQLELLAQQSPSPEQAPALQLMLSSTERMIRQVNQLLSLARAEPSHFERTRLDAVALDQLVEETIQHFVEQAAHKDIDLGFNLQPTVVQGDRFLLRDLVDNLVDNAIRYTPPKGVVTVSCFPHLGGGMLMVEDSGPGIPAAKRELVFQRFARLDDKTTGSGLGLAIVRDIAIAHGASVAIDAPHHGPGAIFSVYFPA